MMNFEIVEEGASIYTHDGAMQIVDLFESLLDRYNIFGNNLRRQ